MPGATAGDLRRDYLCTEDMVAMYFNTAAFVQLNSQARGDYGNATRELMYGLADSTTDLAILRTRAWDPA